MPAGSSAPPALQIGNFPSLTSKRTNTMKWSSSSSSSASLPSSASNTPTKSVASLPCFSGAISSSSLSSFQLKDEDLERSRVGIQGLTAEGSSSVASEASSECGAKEGGDLLLATAISVAKKGGVGKRKGGRGRKVGFSSEGSCGYAQGGLEPCSVSEAICNRKLSRVRSNSEWGDSSIVMQRNGYVKRDDGPASRRPSTHLHVHASLPCFCSRLPCDMSNSRRSRCGHSLMLLVMLTFADAIQHS